MKANKNLWRRAGRLLPGLNLPKPGRLRVNGLILVTVLSLIGGWAGAATNDVGALLQKGLFEEEANRNLDAAIEAYRAVVTRTDKDHQFAATAIFRLGECYRKQGKTNEANAQYQRILREFPDQTDLVKLSREYAGSPSQPRGGAPQAAALGGANPEQILTIRDATESAEIKRIQAVLKDSPDLIDAPEQGVTFLNRAAMNGQLRLAKFLLDNHADVERSAKGGGLSPLMNAVQGGQKEMVELLIQAGADVNATSRQSLGYGPLHFAAENGFRAIAETLVAHGAKVNAKETRDGGTSLNIATEKGFKTVVELLLAHGAEVNAPDFHGDTPLYSAIASGNQAIFDLLLAHHAEVNAADQGGRTPLMQAIFYKREEMARALLAQGADVNAAQAADNVEGRKWTALHKAVSLDETALVKLLLAHGADPNQAVNANYGVGIQPGNPLYDAGKLGFTPLMIAASKGGIETARALLENRADINLKSDWGQTALMVAVLRNDKSFVQLLLEHQANANLPDDQGMTPLLRAASMENGFTVAKLLVEHGADVNLADPKGMTPLMQAAFSGAGFEIAKLLLEHGADATRRLPDPSQSNAKWTALDFAVRGNENPLVKLLLENKADPNATFDSIYYANNSIAHDPGFSPLLLAVSQDQTETAAILLAHGARVNQATDDGRTPLHQAARYGLKEMAELLLANHAEINARDKRESTPLDLTWMPNSPHPPMINARQQSVDLEQFLRQHGAVSGVELFTIRFAGPGRQPQVYFRQTRDFQNEHTLFELLGDIYAPARFVPSHGFDRNGNPAEEPPGARFPDLSKIKINRLGEKGGTNVIVVNAEELLQAGDCSKDVPLRWGDEVAIAETDHKIDARWSGLPEKIRSGLEKCLRANVSIGVKGQTINIALTPSVPFWPPGYFQSFRGLTGLPGEAGRTPGRAATDGSEAKTVLRFNLLNDVVRAANVILSSSDLTRVKVKHHDKFTGKTEALIFNLEKSDPATDLWLHDGDAIEIPEKGGE